MSKTSKDEVRKTPLNVVVTGVGGQGNILLTYLLSRALTRKGYAITIGETYGASQRGGPVVSHLRISEGVTYGPLTPYGKAHLIIGLEPVEMLRAIGLWGNPDVVVISNTWPVYPIDVMIGNADYPTLEEIEKATHQLSKKAWFIGASEIAIELGIPVAANIVMGGAAIGTGVLPISKNDFDHELKAEFSPEKYDINRKAFLKGLESVTSAPN